MTREELKQVYCLNRELRMWQDKLAELEAKSLVRSPQITGMPFVEGASNNTANEAQRRAEMKMIIEEQIAKIEAQQDYIMRWIQTIDDSEMRQIVYYRAVLCKTWRWIANRIGLMLSEDGVRKAYNRFIKSRKD